MYSIGLDISKSSVNVHVPLGALDLEIENTLNHSNHCILNSKNFIKKR